MKQSLSCFTKDNGRVCGSEVSRQFSEFYSNSDLPGYEHKRKDYYNLQSQIVFAEQHKDPGNYQLVIRIKMTKKYFCHSFVTQYE